MVKPNLTSQEAIDKLKSEIEKFLKDNRSFFRNQGNRLSSYFEMACYNHIVSYYKNSGWHILIKNLQQGKQFKYKLSTAGYPENFSYFMISKDIEYEDTTKQVKFEIHHNLCVQSAINEDIYITPDISIVNEGSITHDDEHYLKGHYKKFSYAKNKNLQTFCEVKQFNPFPELLYSFMGLYTELVVIKEDDEKSSVDIEHIAPSLMVSGKENLHTQRIKEHLEKRGEINILFDLFQNGKFKFGKKTLKNLKRVHAKNYSYSDNVLENINIPIEKFADVEDDDSPF